MSLQVWLPLNGDLRNQGLSDLSFSGEERFVTVDNNGKIGKCYHNSGFYNNGFTAGGLISDKEINLGQNQSMFCWFKFFDYILIRQTLVDFEEDFEEYYWYL